MVRATLSIGLVSLAVTSGCATPRGGSIAEKQQHVRQMRDNTLTELYDANPALRAKVDSAAGYGVFSNVNVHVIFVGGDLGYGVVVDKRTGEETYMRMAGLGAGLGAGVQDFRALFIFSEPEVLNKFVDRGWVFGSDAEAAAMASDTGLAAGSHASYGSAGATAGASGQAGGQRVTGTGTGIEVYQLTKSGLAAQITIAGTKFYRDDDLNGR